MISQRPIDKAMFCNQPEKNFMRRLWVDEIQKIEEDGYNENFPLYLTMPGITGGELELLLERGILNRTETGAICEEDFHKIVALESSSNVQVELRRKYPGLNILQMPVQSLIRGDNQRKFPDNKNEINYCKARVINLDLNEPIGVEESRDELSISVIQWIKKFCVFHKEAEIDWSLYLTLHGDLIWNSNVNTQVIKFLVDNCNNDEEFKSLLKSHLGDDITQSIFDGQIDFTTIDRGEKQKVAMVLIPKLLVKFAVNEGWIIETILNYAYEGGNGAPMVTWIFKFHLDNEATSRSLTEYINGIRNIFHKIGFINRDGELFLEK